MVPGLIQNSYNGAEVFVRGDGRYSVDYFEDGAISLPFWRSQNSPSAKIASNSAEMYEKLRKAGVEVQFSGRDGMAKVLSKVIPVAGAFHPKVTLIEDKFGRKHSFWGGTNLNEDKGDFMIHSIDPSIYNILDAILIRNFKNPYRQNTVFCDPNKDLSIFYEAGKGYSSPVMDTLSWLMEKDLDFLGTVSQLYPTPGVMRQLIKVASRGTQVDVVVPHASHPNLNSLLYKPFRLISQMMLKNAHLAPNIYHCSEENPFTHAKGIVGINEMRNENWTLTGSHNLTLSGVLLNMEDLALLINDESLAHQFISFMASLRQKQSI